MRVISSFNPKKHKSYYKKPFRKTKGFYLLILLILVVGSFVYWSITKPPTEEEQPIALEEIEVPQDAVAQITYIKGILQKRSGESLTSLSKNDQLLPGDTVETGAESRAIIEFPDGSLVRMASGTTIRLKQFGHSDIIIEQTQGIAFHRVNDQSQAIYRVTSGQTEYTALGTAFNVNINTVSKLTVTDSRVKVKVFESDSQDNIINMRTIDEGTVARIDPSKEGTDSIDSEPIAVEDLLEDDWYVWNKDEDESNDFFLGIFAANVVLEILEPTETEFESEDDKLVIKGKTDPEAEIFIQGSEVATTEGNFEHSYDLEAGENIIEIVAKLGKKKNKKVLYVKTKDDTNDDLVLTATADESTASLSWVLNEGSASAFKVLKSTIAKPQFPDDSFHSIPGSGTTDSWDNLNAGTYHFRVCIYEQQKCSSYSNDVSVTIEESEDEEEPENTGSATISLSASGTGAEVSLKWDITGDLKFEGLKLVVNTSPNPTFPGNSVHSLPASARSDRWLGLGDGNYHFRLCGLVEGVCSVYSNNAEVTFGTTPVVTGGSILLSGSSAGGAVSLSWAASTTSTEGFRAMISETAGATFPGSQFVLLTSSTAATATFSDLDVGKSYFFRVCSNVGTSCNTYSNEISVMVK